MTLVIKISNPATKCKVIATIKLPTANAEHPQADWFCARMDTNMEQLAHVNAERVARMAYNMAMELQNATWHKMVYFDQKTDEDEQEYAEYAKDAIDEPGLDPCDESD